MLPIATGYLGYTPIQFYEMTPLEFLFAARGYRDEYNRELMVRANSIHFTAACIRNKRPPGIKKIFLSLGGTDDGKKVKKKVEGTSDKLRGLLSGANSKGIDRKGALERRYELARMLNKKKAGNG